MPTFENVTGSSGINYTGQNWAAVWTDFNNDGYPDLWLSTHNPFSFTPGAPAVLLFVNDKHGGFRNLTSRIEVVQKDLHGAVSADFDNDGDQDIAQLSGGSTKGGAVYFENLRRDGLLHLDDTSSLHDLDLYSTSPGRNGLALDFNNDGLMDFYLGADRTSTGGSGGTGPILLRQTAAGTFVDGGVQAGFTVPNGISPLLSDLNGDGVADLIVTHYGKINAIYDMSGTRFRDIKDSLLGDISIPKFDDIAIADFNHDGRPDIYLTRNEVEDEVAVGGKQVRAYISTVASGDLKAFTFASDGPQTFTFPRNDGSINYDQIHVGAAGRNPITARYNPTFELSPTDSGNVGIAPHTTSDTGLYIGYDTASHTWRCEVVGNARVARGFTVDSTLAITNLQTEGFPLNPNPEPDQLLLNTPNGFIDRTAWSGVGAMRIFGNSVVAGDFDNDGDIDLYIDQASAATNRGNIILWNAGNGKFTPDFGSGAGGGAKGLGGSTAVADYDHDGSLDLAVTNGGGEPPFNALNSGPVQIFHNLGNDNHWLEVRLHGVDSTKDAVGARVFVTTGNLRQLREAVDGQHLKAQDFRDLHFGLGQEATIDVLRVDWPRSAPTILHNVPADQILDIYEGQQSSSLEPADGATSLHAMNDGETLDLSASHREADATLAFSAAGQAPLADGDLGLAFAVLAPWSGEDGTSDLIDFGLALADPSAGAAASGVAGFDLAGFDGTGIMADAAATGGSAEGSGGWLLA